MGERIGTDVGAAEYWAQRTSDYLDGLQGPYHLHRFQVVQRLLAGLPPMPKTVVDFGCGNGILLSQFDDDDTALTGIDIDPQMIEAARKRLGARAELRIGGVEQLTSVEDASVDVLLSLNVNAYFTGAEDKAFYEHVARVLRPSGSLVITHSNKLFDLFSLNGFTARFVAQELCTESVADTDVVAQLLVNAERFKEDERSGHFAIRENPLAYGLKLAAHGLVEVQQEFANRHPAPPALMDAAGFNDIDARNYPPTLDLPESERWKLLFTCSMFGARAVRQ